MPRVENWRTKYERQWKRFEKAKATAEERGYILPKEVTEIQKAKGGYRQAFGRIKQYTLTKIQRLSAYSTQEGVVPGGRIMSQARQRNKNIFSSLGEFYTIRKARASVPKIDVQQVLAEAYKSFKQKYAEKEERSKIADWFDEVEAVSEPITDTTSVDPYSGLRYEYEEYLKEVRKDAEEKILADEHKPILDKNGNVLRERTEEDIQNLIERYYQYNKPSIEQYAMQKETEEAIQLYKDTYEAMTGKEPDYIPKGLSMSSVQEYLARVQRQMEAPPQVMSAQDVKENMLLEVQHTIASFNNRFLRYKVQDKLKQAFTDDREGTMKRLTEGMSEMNEKLQQAATYQYEGDFENNADSQSSQFYNWWTDFITGSFSSEDQLDYAESEYE